MKIKKAAPKIVKIARPKPKPSLNQCARCAGSKFC